MTSAERYPDEHDDRVDVDPEDDELDDEPRRGGPGAFLREVVVVVATAIVLSLLIKTFLVQAFFIPSESMQPTLEVGDRVLVSRLTPGPFDLERGDVVVTPYVAKRKGGER